MAAKDIYLVPAIETIRRDDAWHANNMQLAPGSPAAKHIKVIGCSNENGTPDRI
jgi:hypothetical protein